MSPLSFVDLAVADERPLSRRLYRQVRDAIRDGRLNPAQRLPSTRNLARDLGIGRNSVIAAYEQLHMEGYLETRRGGGSVVSAASQVLIGQTSAHQSQPAPVQFSKAGVRLAAIARTRNATPRAFTTGMPDIRHFPRDLWGRLLRRAARHISPDWGGYAHYSGLPRLKEAILAHVAETRGVVAKPDNVLVFAGAQAALDLTARLFLDPGDPVAMEEPGYHGARAAFHGTSARILPLPIDDDGVRDDGLAALLPEKPKLFYVTPSHQYPMGALMSLERRVALLKMAEQVGGFIIEDDYDSEFHFRGDPIATLQGLDGGRRVLYLGTFAKSMMPSLRLAYMIVPDHLVEIFSAAQRNTGQVSDLVQQYALADFIEAGDFRAHLRQMCALYHGRRDHLAGLLQHEAGVWLRPVLADGGMQLAVLLRDQTLDDQVLADALLADGVDCSPLSPFYIGKPAKQGLLLGFSCCHEAEQAEGVARIVARLRTMTGG